MTLYPSPMGHRRRSRVDRRRSAPAADRASRACRCGGVRGEVRVRHPGAAEAARRHPSGRVEIEAAPRRTTVVEVEALRRRGDRRRAARPRHRGRAEAEVRPRRGRAGDPHPRAGRRRRRARARVGRHQDDRPARGRARPLGERRHAARRSRRPAGRQHRVGRRRHCTRRAAAARSAPRPETSSSARPAKRLGVKTASGDLVVGAIAEGGLDLKSASGDMRIGIAAGSRLHVDARSLSGETSSDIEVLGVETAVEGPLVELKATSMSGDIRLDARVIPASAPREPALPDLLRWGSPSRCSATRSPLIALPLVGVLVLDATPAQMGYLAAAALLPNLLFSLHAGAWVDRARPPAPDDDRRRSRPCGAARYRSRSPTARRADVRAALRGRVPDRPRQRLLLRLLQHAVRLARAARALRRGQLAAATAAGRASFVAGPSLGGLLVQLPDRAGRAGRRRRVVRLLGALARADQAASSRRPRSPSAGTSSPGCATCFGSPTDACRLAATATINFFNFVFFALFVLYATRYLDVSPGCSASCSAPARSAG